jgi:hypothetical protein
VEDSALGEQTYADNQGKRFTLKPGEVVSRRAQTTSLMPDDLVTTMTEQEFRDLMAYLRHPRIEDGADGSASRP